MSLMQKNRKLNKEKKQKNRTKYEPQLIEIGAICKSECVYELDDCFLYPSKAFAMNKKIMKKIRLSRFFKRFNNG